MMNKITAREAYTTMKDIFEHIEGVENAALLVEFCDKEIAKIDRRNGAANNELREAILNVLSTEEFMTGTDIILALNDPAVTPSKISSQLKTPIADGDVVKEEIVVEIDGKKAKRMAYRKVNA